MKEAARSPRVDEGVELALKNSCALDFRFHRGRSQDTFKHFSLLKAFIVIEGAETKETILGIRL